MIQYKDNNQPEQDDADYHQRDLQIRGLLRHHPQERLHALVIRDGLHPGLVLFLPVTGNVLLQVENRPVVTLLPIEDVLPLKHPQCDVKAMPDLLVSQDLAPRVLAADHARTRCLVELFIFMQYAVSVCADHAFHPIQRSFNRATPTLSLCIDETHVRLRCG